LIVYIATNLSNGKVYVGKTIRDISHAKARHHQRAKFAWKYGTYGRFYSAIRKYGFENFTWHIAYRGTSDADIQLRERELIASQLAMDPIHGYNMTPGGDGGAGKILSAQHRARMSTAFSGDGNPMFGKTGASHPAFGNRHTEETRKKISAAHKGKPKSAETRAKLSATRIRLLAPQKEATVARKKAERLAHINQIRQKIESGAYKGELAGPSKVTNLARVEICKLRSNGISYLEISEKYPLGLTGIRAICQTWGPLNGFPFLKIDAKRKTKLSDKSKHDVCKQYSEGLPMSTLAAQYQVGETTIHTILRKWGPENSYTSLRSKGA